MSLKSRCSTIVDEKLAENGLDGMLSQQQIDRIIVIIMNIKDSGLFTGEEADRPWTVQKTRLTESHQATASRTLKTKNMN